MLGLDLGEKRVGMAIADSLTRVATPLQTAEIRGKKHLAELLRPIIADHAVEMIVVGLPTTLRGEMGPAAQRIAADVEWLKSQVRVKWVFWDERLSTQEVERVLVDADVSHRKRKEVRDQLAAQRILQNYLDFHEANKRQGKDEA